MFVLWEFLDCNGGRLLPHPLIVSRGGRRRRFVFIGKRTQEDQS